MSPKQRSTKDHKRHPGVPKGGELHRDGSGDPKLTNHWGNIGVTLGSYWDNGKGHGNY